MSWPLQVEPEVEPEPEPEPQFAPGGHSCGNWIHSVGPNIIGRPSGRLSGATSYWKRWEQNMQQFVGALVAIMFRPFLPYHRIDRTNHDPVFSSMIQAISSIGRS